MINTLAEKNGLLPKGYLNESFRIFHVKDLGFKEAEFHYHEFHKIIIPINGKTNYLTEAGNHSASPGEILIVPASTLHRPVYSAEEECERYIIWFDRSSISFLEEALIEKLALMTNNMNPEVLQISLKGEDGMKIVKNMAEIETETLHKLPFSKTMTTALFYETLVKISRCADQENRMEPSMFADSMIKDVTDYITNNLTTDLGIDEISAALFISKSYLMHRFKDITGDTIHQFVIRKRLAVASSLIASGNRINEACISAGFKDYSSFARAFKKSFGKSPREYNRNVFANNNSKEWN